MTSTPMAPSASTTMLVLLPFLGALLMPLLHRAFGTGAAWVAVGVPAALFAAFLAQAPAVLAGRAVEERLAWVPRLGLDLLWRLDGWSLLFALLVSGIGLLVTLYAHFYLGAREDRARFFLSLLLFMGAMLGLVLAGNLLLMYVFWELTSVSSFLLIGFWHQSGNSREGALKSLLLTSGGGLAMLAGIAWIGASAGTLEFGRLAEGASDLAARPGFGLALSLLLVGAFAKSAQVPFHIWLPDAMAAPTPVSAYLHSATMVKAGLFLLGRLLPFAGHWPPWTPAVAGCGLATMLLGAALALRRFDLKSVLALSTVSQLGLIAALLGLATPAAAAAAAAQLFSHALFKGGLFLTVGAVDHAAGSRDIRRLAGLRREMPLTFLFSVLAALSMAGAPPLGGFATKELFFAATLAARGQGPAAGAAGWIAAASPWLATAASMLTVAYSLIFVHRIWFGRRPAEEADLRPHEAGPGLLIPIGALVAGTVALGLFPQAWAGPLLRAAAAALGGPEAAEALLLSPWPHVSLPFLLSVIALAGGVAAYARLGPLREGLDRLAQAVRLDGDATYAWAIAALERGARRLTRRTMTGRLRDYLGLIWLAVLALVGHALWRGGLYRLPALDLSPVAPAEGLLALGAVGAAILVVRARRRLVATAALGLVGAAVSLFWVLLRSPDLALTQIAIEAIGIVLLLLVFPHLPELPGRSDGPIGRGLAAAISIGVGLLIAWLALLGNTTRLFDSVAGFFVEKSLTEGGGRNIVNVILVDFRGFDTMGEITVLTVGGLAVYALVRLRGPASPPATADASETGAPEQTPGHRESGRRQER